MEEYGRQRRAYDVAMIQRQNKQDEAAANRALPPLPPAARFREIGQAGRTYGRRDQG